MSLQQAPPSRVFVELVPWANRGRENHLVSSGETPPAALRPVPPTQLETSTREVHVSGTSEVSASPDRAQVAVRVSSSKDAAAEAKKSVCRRLDYIAQSLQQQGVQVREAVRSGAMAGGAAGTWSVEQTADLEVAAETGSPTSPCSCKARDAAFLARPPSGR